MRTFLRGVILVNIVLLAALNAVGCAGAIYAHGWWEGWGMIQSWYSPFNLANWTLNLVLFSPALVCIWLLGRRRD